MRRILVEISGGLAVEGVLPGAQAGTAPVYVLTATGAIGAVTWTVGNLGDEAPLWPFSPPGRSATASGNTLSFGGTFLTPGDWQWRVRCRDSVGQSWDQLLPVAVSAAPALSITGDPPTVYTGGSYSWTPTIVGGVPPYSVVYSGDTLPAALSVDPSTGEISASMTTDDDAGHYAGTLTVTDAASATAQQLVELTVATGVPLHIVPFEGWPPPLIRGVLVVADAANLLFAMGGVGVKTWAIADGDALPDGLALDMANGDGGAVRLVGAPTTLGAAAPCTVNVTDARGTLASITLNLTVVAASLSLIGWNVLQTTPGLRVGMDVSSLPPLRASGGSGVYTYTFSQPVPGIYVTPDGQWRGSFNVAGNYSTQITVTDSYGNSTGTDLIKFGVAA